jgi:tetratricopeptide (TPR) repeat protein
MPHLIMLLLSLCFASTALAKSADTFVPDNPDTVIERLPRGYSTLMPDASRDTDRKAASQATVIAQARALLTAAAQTGDARLASRAEALLSRFPATTMQPDVLRLRAFSAQHRHDFNEARRLLDRLIELDPRAGDARLSRAQLHLIAGRIDAARADCIGLTLGIDTGSGLLCAAMLSLRTDRYAAAAQAVDLWLQQNPGNDAESRRFALTLRGEIAAQAGDPRAETYFRRALALMPTDTRTLAAYARSLRAAGRERAVESLLSAHPGHDGLQLQRALALRPRDLAKARRIAAGLARSYALAHALGRSPELRDEAEYLLSFRKDPRAALALAQRNFEHQRDREDVELLIRAAVAAGQPEALRPMQVWAAAQRLPMPVVTSLTGTR